MRGRRRGWEPVMYGFFFFQGRGVGGVTPPSSGDTRITQDLDRRTLYGGDVRVVH